MAVDDGVVASAFVLVLISEVASFTGAGARPAFSERELAYAHAKSDPERRLAARLAAKQAALELLGPGFELRDIEVVRGHGAPTLRFSPRAEARLAHLGASRALVSLTHERRQAAASVLLLREG